MSDRNPAAARLVGQEVVRREDLRHLTGRARFTADVADAGTLHAVFVRSPHAHAEITAVDLAAAREAPGVVALFTGADLRGRVAAMPCNWVLPGMPVPAHPPLATDVVRFHGEAVAVVVADDPYRARDAAAAVAVDYRPLPAVTDVLSAAADGAPLVHAELGSNEVFRFPGRGGNYARAARRADVRLRHRLVNQNVVPAALEPRAVHAAPDPATGQLTVHTSTQAPHTIRRLLAEVLGIPEDQLRVVAPDVGGGFGAKLHLYPEEVVCAFVARTLARPVAWTATRSEDFLATNHGRDHVQDLEVSARRDGTITGIKAVLYANLGAYLSGMGPGVPAVNCAFMLTGTYRIPNVDVVTHGLLTHTSRIDTYRGAGRPEATYLIERAVDLLAAELGMDPAEIRRRNFIPADAFPYRLPIRGFTYDSGDYEPALRKALELVDYPAQRRRQRALREQGRYLGIGLCSYTEFTGIGPGQALNMIGFRYGGWEYGRVQVHPTGAVTVSVGTADHGQGHATSYAQIAADALQVPMERITVVEGDTGRVGAGNGTFNSRSLPTGGVAVQQACEAVVAKARQIAAHALGVDPTDIEHAGGCFRVRPDVGALARVRRTARRQRRTVVAAVVRKASGFVVPGDGLVGNELSWDDVARLADTVAVYPGGVTPGLDEHAFYQPTDMTFPFGSYAVVVEVDPETGDLTWERFVAVDDCGPLINPLLARGQVHGGVAQGVGQALLEGARYADDGRLASGDFMTYAFPRAQHLPHIDTAHTVTATPLNPLGVKGIGEAGAIAAPPAVVNAVLDALAPLGVTHLDMPLTPERIWSAIQVAGQRPSSEARTTSGARS